MSTPVPGDSPGPESLGFGDPGRSASSGRGINAVVVVPATAAPVDATEDTWSGRVIDQAPTAADEVALLVLAVPGVVRLHAGRFGEVATYLPGRRVTGVKLGDRGAEVHVVVAAGAPIRQTAQRIHAAVAPLVAGPVHVYIEDVTFA